MLGLSRRPQASCSSKASFMSVYGARGFMVQKNASFTLNEFLVIYVREFNEKHAKSRANCHLIAN